MQTVWKMADHILQGHTSRIINMQIWLGFVFRVVIRGVHIRWPTSTTVFTTVSQCLVFGVTVLVSARVRGNDYKLSCYPSREMTVVTLPGRWLVPPSREMTVVTLPGRWLLLPFQGDDCVVTLPGRWLLLPFQGDNLLPFQGDDYVTLPGRWLLLPFQGDDYVVTLPGRWLCCYSSTCREVVEQVIMT